MKALLLIITLVLSTTSYAGAMSTVDLLVREAASSDFGEIFYDEWQLTNTTSVKGCLMTVKASTSFRIKLKTTLIEGLYCVTKGDDNSLSVKRVVED